METEVREDNLNNPGNGEDEPQEEATPIRDTAGTENQTLKAEVLYLKAEFENYKKRILREQDQSIKFANEKLLRELLSIVDLLDRGINHGKQLARAGEKKGPGHADDLRAFLSGIELTSKELSQLLTRFGVEFIGVAGEKFDPSRHEAIAELESENVGTILEVLQRGCFLHGRLLTPAKVVVGKPKA